MSPLTDPIGPDLTATLRALKLGKLTATLPERLTLARQHNMPTPTSSSSSCPTVARREAWTPTGFVDTIEVARWSPRREPEVGQARKKYTQEYKDEAVELVISSGRPIAEIARNLGINEGTLANWVNTAKKSGKLKEKPLDTDERAELRELRDENRRLRMERDFLKKAAAWFAKENQ